ncbi:hypothetical protein [Streptomyces sp. NPDC051286]|uniref:hypothetical protein n=1 Tax=Streptomyces sp. NPDC051286 TaxID=3365647 RepID=UPI0037B44661
MASTTHSAARSVEHCRSLSRRVGARSGPASSRAAGTADGSGWPDATQMWTWAAEAAMSGYGPGSAYFC